MWARIATLLSSCEGLPRPFAWAFATITSIGYGDISATPFNASEQAIGTLLMLCSALLWGYTIATFCGVIQNHMPAWYASVALVATRDGSLMSTEASP